MLQCYLNQQMCSLCLSHNNLLDKTNITDSAADGYNIGQIVASVANSPYKVFLFVVQVFHHHNTSAPLKHLQLFYGKLSYLSVLSVLGMKTVRHNGSNVTQIKPRLSFIVLRYFKSLVTLASRQHVLALLDLGFLLSGDIPPICMANYYHFHSDVEQGSSSFMCRFD